AYRCSHPRRLPSFPTRRSSDRVGDVNRLVEDCARYWIEAGVPRRRVAEMRLELTQHLEAAAAEGRSPESVVGPDVGKFAQEWARSEEHTSELQSRENLVCRLLL